MIEPRREREQWIRSREVCRGLFLLACLLGCEMVGGSQARAQTPSRRIAVLDRVVADVDGQAILASDVDDEMRFSALQPGVEPAQDNTPQRALNRVIDRTLIDQQRALQPGVAVVSRRTWIRRLKPCASRFRPQQTRIARRMQDGRHFWRSMDLRRVRFKIGCKSGWRS